ncbi:MAG: hypothetical protein ACJA0Z_004391 [Halioglobus sp.]|jgi:hypothetical protein
MYSQIESAKGCGLEPRAYLQALFEQYTHGQYRGTTSAAITDVFQT